MGPSARGVVVAGALRGERVQPLEGLVDLGGAETGLAEFLEEGATAERIVVADEVGVLGEVVLEQVQQDVQDALFHFPRPAPLAAR